MSKDTISVNMNVYDIPILVEQLEKANKEIKILKEEYMMLQNASDEVEEEKDKEIERLNNIINKAIEDKKIEKLERFIPQKESDTYCTKYNEVADKINEIIDKINAGVDK